MATHVFLNPEKGIQYLGAGFQGPAELLSPPDDKISIQYANYEKMIAQIYSLHILTRLAEPGC